MTDDRPNEQVTNEHQQIQRPHRRIFISTSSAFGSTLLIALLGAVLLRVMTVNLGPNSYGIFVTATTFVSIAMLLTDLGINSVTGRAITKDPTDASSILGYNIGLRLFLSIAFVPLIWIVGALSYRTHIHSHDIIVGIIIVGCAIPFDAVRAVSMAYFVSRIENHRTSLINIVQQASFVGFVIIAVRLDRAVLGCYIAYLASTVIASSLAVVSVRRRVTFRPRLAWARWWMIIKESFAIGIIQVANVIYLIADRVMLSLLAAGDASTAVGYYQVAYAIIMFFLVIPVMYMTSVMPLLTKSVGTAFTALVERSVRHLSIIGALVTAGCITTGAGVIHLLAGPKFAPAATPLSILSVSVLLTALTNVFGFANFSQDRHHKMLYVSLAGLSLNVVVNLWAIPHHGIVGAATVTVISEILMTIGTYAVFRTQVGHGISVLASMARPIFAAGAAVGVVFLVCGPNTAAIGATAVRGLVVIASFVGVLALLGGWPPEATALLRRSSTPK